LEDLVESSAGHIKPTPWTRSDLTSTDSQGNKTPIKPLTRENIGKPLITLETTQKYVRQDIQELLKTTANQIPFLRPFENMLSLDKADYSAVEKGEISLITKRIDGRHPAEGILISFHSDYYAEKNQLWNLVNPLPASASAVSSKDYYNTMKFLVAAKDRESDWTSEIWRGLSPYTKCEKCPGIPVSWISFTYGPGFGYRAPERRKPSGTLNFSKADRPTLWMDIQDTLPNSRGQKKVMLRATTIGWGIYRIEGQRGALFFGN
jgi:hypothetical protein